MKSKYIASIILMLSLFISPEKAMACLPSSVEGFKSLINQSHFRCLEGHIPNDAMEYLKAGEQHYKDGNILSADQHIRYGLWVASKALGSGNPEIVNLLNAIGNLYLAKGDFKKSEQYLYTAIDSAKKIGNTGGGSSINMKSLISDMGNLYKSQNLPSGEAERLYNSALRSLDISPSSWKIDMPSLDEAVAYVKRKAASVSNDAKQAVGSIR